MAQTSIIFSPFQIGRLSLKNRITMAPFFTGYASDDGTVSPLFLDYYREVSASGASLIVVENASVDPSGAGSPFILRADDDQFISDLSRLASVIKDEGAFSFLQINHAGRYAFMPNDLLLAPSPIETSRSPYKEVSVEDIDRIVQAYAKSARRVKEAGFDGVEIHGGTGYLLVQFLSSRTNLRTDEYGGSIENRMRFPLRVVDAVLDAVGNDFPVGYRFLADEELSDGLHPEETKIFARELDKRGLAYLSVMAGTYDSFVLPEYIEMEKNEAYMAHYAGIIKKEIKTPVITAGRIQTPETACKIIEEGTADLIGLARVLFADPLWPKKAEGKISDPINKCEPGCSLCMSRIMRGEPALCSQWAKDRLDAFRSRIGET